MSFKLAEYLPKIQFNSSYGKYTSMKESPVIWLKSFHKHRKINEMETFQTIPLGANLSFIWTTSLKGKGPWWMRKRRSNRWKPGILHWWTPMRNTSTAIMEINPLILSAGCRRSLSDYYSESEDAISFFRFHAIFISAVSAMTMFPFLSNAAALFRS